MPPRVDRFDHEADGKRAERAVILRRLLASKCDTLEAPGRGGCGWPLSSRHGGGGFGRVIFPAVYWSESDRGGTHRTSGRQAPLKRRCQLRFVVANMLEHIEAEDALLA
jgi:hypothetical protein